MNAWMRCTVACAGVWLAAARAAPAAEPIPDINTVAARLRFERPRLFLTPDRLAAIRRDGLSAAQQAWLTALKRQVDTHCAPPDLDPAFLLSPENGVRYTATHTPRVRDGDWGHVAAQAALVWLLTGDREYRDRAVSFLAHAAAVWDLIYRHHRIPASRVFSKMNALSAYDWLFNDMSRAERQAIGAPLFNGVYWAYAYWAGVEMRQEYRPFSTVMPMSYSDSGAAWFLGLAFLGAGLDGVADAACLELLRDSYAHYLANFREDVPEPDGIRLCGAIGYFTQGAVGSKVNFMDSWRSATGDSFARYVPQFANFALYTLWASIHPRSRQPLEYGWADSHHDHNHMDFHAHPAMGRIPDLFVESGGRLDLDALAAAAQAQAPVRFEPYLDSSSLYLTPASPLLMSPRVLSEPEIEAGLARLPRARHFPDPVGQTFMNTGWGSNDTYAMFIAGRQTQARKHNDENHFTIYKKGFLAMDTGARQGAAGHANNYYNQTVAHNAILIHMDGERQPALWGAASEVDTGGMNRNHGARVLAFETDSHVTYIASDATSCYHSNKAVEVVRQFLFVYPDWFVVFDRVESKQPDQKKTWLFHTQLEPAGTADTFRAEHREGAVFVRTLLPRDRASEKIGGPGREFWVGGKQWPANEAMQRLMADADGRPTPDRHLFGQWRMEISPAQARTRDLFLHLIEVGDKTALSAMTPSTLIEDDRTAGVEFQAGPRTVRVVFHKDGDVGGHIRIAEGATVLADRPLATTVQKQEGLALAR